MAERSARPFAQRPAQLRAHLTAQCSAHRPAQRNAHRPGRVGRPVWKHGGKEGREQSLGLGAIRGTVAITATSAVASPRVGTGTGTALGPGIGTSVVIRIVTGIGAKDGIADGMHVGTICVPRFVTTVLKAVGPRFLAHARPALGPRLRPKVMAPPMVGRMAVDRASTPTKPRPQSMLRPSRARNHDPPPSEARKYTDMTTSSRPSDAA